MTPQLLRPSDGGASAGVAETHSGIVVFLGERAYKFKKPLDLGFLDYSAQPARRAACENEVRLNRRLAPDVYLGVGEVGGIPGEAPEPVVIMRRLPAERRLSALAAAGEPLDDEIVRLAHVIAAFHAAAPVTEAAVAAASADATLRRWESNGREMAALRLQFGDPDLIDAIVAGARHYLAGRRPLLAQRITAGRARDGHGDLLADDVFCMEDGPRVLDCLEFDESLRSGDILADAAFLAMDLERLGRAELGWRFLALHRDGVGDAWPDSLAHHHIAYRAQVRAKVTALRLEQEGVRQAGAGQSSPDHYLAIAKSHLEAGRVRLVLTGGGPATGKSTLAAALADQLGAVVLRSDEIRKELAGLASTDRAAAPQGEGIYRPEMTAATYSELLARARHLLALGESVILDASWHDGRWRQSARGLAADGYAALTELRCVAPVDVVARRAEERARSGSDPSDADAVMAVALAGKDDRWPEAVEIDTTDAPARSVAAALAVVARAGQTGRNQT